MDATSKSAPVSWDRDVERPAVVLKFDSGALWIQH